MMNSVKLYTGISRCAWGYFFLYFDINFGPVSVLPRFVGFWLFLSAIDLLSEEERELKLLRPLCIGLLVWHIIVWGLSFIGQDPDGWVPFVDVIVCIAELYFQFQLLTNLASIAMVHQPEGSGHDGRILKCRTMQTVLITAGTVSGQLAPLLGDFWGYLSLGMILIYLIAGIYIMAALFSLRKSIAQ